MSKSPPLKGQVKNKSRKARRLARELTRCLVDMNSYLLTYHRDHPAVEFVRSASEFASSLYGLTIAADNALHRPANEEKKP